MISQRFLLVCAATMLLALASPARAQSNAPGYDVFLLAGQSNMEGTGTGVDITSDGVTNPRLWQWDGPANLIVPAVDPIYTFNGIRNLVGLGMTFGKAYLSSLPPNRQVLLVNAAIGGTGFADGTWIAGKGIGAITAVQYANAAMSAAGPGAHFAGILWHQGESDIIENGAAAYETNLLNLIAYFKGNITGATANTPVVVGEMTPAWLTGNVTNNIYAPQQFSILENLHTLPDVLPFSAWTSGELLPSDSITGTVHFSALSQRILGRRYAKRFFFAANSLPQPEMSLESWSGTFYDDGRGLLNLSSLPTNNPPNVIGTVSSLVDPFLGNVASISQGQGYLSISLPSTAFNGSYTKMAWFQPGNVGSINYLIAGSNPGQAHFLQVQTVSDSQVTISAGHSNGPANANLSATITVPQSRWMLIALVYNAGTQTMSLYADGIPVATKSNILPAPGSSSSASTLPVLLGSFNGSRTNAFDGQMTLNRVWTSALTAAQIAAIYTFENNTTPDSLTFGSVAASSASIRSYPFSPSPGSSITSITVLSEGVAGGDFSLNNRGTCIVAATTACTVNVSFTPKFAGLRRGALTIADSSGAQTTVPLTGTGAMVPSYMSPVSSLLVSGLSQPIGVAVDGAGNVYTSEYANGTVIEVNPAGTLLRTIAGLRSPAGLALDGAGNLYVCEVGAADVVKVLPGATTFSPVATGFNSTLSPLGLTSDAVGNLYVADTGNNLIVEVSNQGRSRIVNTGLLTLSAPTGVALDAAGNLYIADYGNHRIVKVPVTGAANSSVFLGDFQNPWSIAIDGAGNLFTVDLTTHTLFEFAAGSAVPTSLVTGLSNPVGIAVGLNGTVYVSDNASGVIAQLPRSVLAAQSVNFGVIPAQLSGTTLTLAASATSGLPVSYTSLTPQICPVSGASAKLLFAGTCRIAATAVGNETYQTSAPVTQAFSVAQNSLLPPVSVALSSGANVYGIAIDGTAPANGGLDSAGYAYSGTLLGTSLNWAGVNFTFGAPGIAEASAGATISLPAGNYSSLKLLGTSVFGAHLNQAFTVTYTDGTVSTFTQSLSDWGVPQSFAGESIVSSMPYRIGPGGGTQSGPWFLYGYSFVLDSTKVVRTITLPSTRSVVTLSIELIPAGPVTALNLSSLDNLFAIANNGAANAGIGSDGYSYSANLLGTSLTANGQTFVLGAPGSASAVTCKTIPLPAGRYASLSFLGTGIYGSQSNQIFTVTYTDGTTANFIQSMSDWGAPKNFLGESIVLAADYRVTPSGASQNGPWNVYSYNFALDNTKTVQSLALPSNPWVVVLAINLNNLPAAVSASSSPTTICQAASAGTFCSDSTPAPADPGAYHNLSWINVNKNLSSIAVSDNQVWGVDSAGVLWFLPNFKTDASWLMLASGVKQISVRHNLACQLNTNQHVLCVTAPNPLLSPVDANGFSTLPWIDTGAANFRQIAVSAGTQFWGITASGDLVQVKDYNHVSTTSTLVSPNVSQVAVDGRGTVCQLSTQQTVSCSNWSAPATAANPAHYFPLPFIQTTATLTNLAMGDGVLWGLDSNGDVWQLPDFTNSGTWFRIAHGGAGDQLAASSAPTNFTPANFAPNDVPVLLVMGQSNAVGINTLPARFVSPSSPNVWRVTSGGWNFLPGNTNGTTPFTKAISSITNVSWSNFGLTATGPDGNLGFNSAPGPGADAANFAVYQWQSLINAGWQLPDLYIIHIAWPSQGVDAADVTGASAAWTTHGVNLWQPMLTSASQPSYALAPFSRQILYRSLQNLLANGKTPRLLGLQWNQWEAEAGNPNIASVTNAPVNYSNLFNGFASSIGSHFPIQIVKPLSTAYGQTALTQMQTVFSNLAAIDSADITLLDRSSVSANIFGGGVLGGGDGSIHYNLDTQQWFGSQAIGVCLVQARCGTAITKLPAAPPN